MTEKSKRKEDIVKMWINSSIDDFLRKDDWRNKIIYEKKVDIGIFKKTSESIIVQSLNRSYTRL